eukprot:330431-Amphidinium_carterae.1
MLCCSPHLRFCLALVVFSRLRRTVDEGSGLQEGIKSGQKVDKEEAQKGALPVCVEDIATESKGQKSDLIQGSPFKLDTSFKLPTPRRLDIANMSTSLKLLNYRVDGFGHV